MRQFRITTSPPPPSRRRPEGNLSRLAGGTGLMFVGGWLAYALSTLFQIAVARSIGAPEFGAYVVGVGIAWVLSQIAPLGMTWAVVRYVAIYRSQDDEDRVRGTIWLGARIAATGGVILGAGMFLAAPFLAARVFHEPQAAVLLRVLSLSVPLSALTELLLSAVQAHTRVVPTVVVRSLVVPALRLTGALGALAIFGGGMVTVACGYLAAEAVALLLAVVALMRVVPRGPFRHPGRQVAQYARPLAAQRFLESGATDFGNVVLAASHSVNLVALFTAAQRFTEVANALFKAVGIALAPMVSDIHTAAQHDHLARLYKAASRWIFMIGVPVFLVQVLFGKWLLRLFGEEFVAAQTALVILAIGQLVNYSTGVTVDVIRMVGRSGLMLCNTTFDVTCYITLNVVLVPRYGLVGAGLAAALQQGTSNIVRCIEVRLIARMHPYSRAFAKPALAGLGAAASVWLVRHLVHVQPALDEVIALLAMAATYLALLAVLRLDEDDRAVMKSLLSRVRAR